jgi:hypothetical protein
MTASGDRSAHLREPAPPGYAADSAGWLPALVTFVASGGRWADYVEALYAAFHADFIASEPAVPNRRWAMKRYPAHDGKEATFWHLISEGDVESEREPDLRRCERIRWPRALIDALGSGRVRVWEQSRRAREVRVAIALPDFSYLVVLADRGEYLMLWTAFPVERSHQRAKLRREYEAYVAAGRRPDCLG